VSSLEDLTDGFVLKFWRMSLVAHTLPLGLILAGEMSVKPGAVHSLNQTVRETGA